MKYTLYHAEPLAGQVDHDELCDSKHPHGDLVARAEDSGSEGCYVEVARWNEQTERYERYCFAKCFGGEHPNPLCKDFSSVRTAEQFASDINGWQDHHDLAPLIHRLPTYQPPSIVPKVGDFGATCDRPIRTKRLNRTGRKTLWNGDHQTWALDADGNVLHCGPRHGPFKQLRAEREVIEWEAWADGLCHDCPDCPTGISRRRTVKLIVQEIATGKTQEFLIPPECSVVLPLPEAEQTQSPGDDHASQD